MRHQTGYVWRVGKSFYGRWYQDDLVTDANGVQRVERRQHSEKLCEYGDRYRSRSDVKPLLEVKLKPLNEGRATPEGTLSVVEYTEKFFLLWAKRELKPSTAHGYAGLWHTYLRLALGGLVMRDFRCVDATNVLAAIHRDHDLGRKSLRHCKGLLSTIFTHAKRAGVIDGENPAKDAGIPRSAKSSEPTYAYSAEEVLGMLNVLEGVARTTVALLFFSGLRPGEGRAARWADYDSDKRTLRVRASMWRTHLTTPKTEESCAVVPVAEILADVLASATRTSEFILAGPSGKPIDLHNLAARVIRPTLTASGIEWHGFYSLRRGLATLAASVDSPIAAKSLLRHSNIQTTAQHYIKSVPAEAARAIEKIDALCDANGKATVQ